VTRALLFGLLLSGCSASTHALDGGLDAGRFTPDAAVVPEPALGATVTSTGVLFRLWAPHAATAEVLLPDASVALTPEDGGVFSAQASVPTGAAYRYRLHTPTGDYTRIDPACRQLLSDGSCAVVDPQSFTWHDQGFTRPTRAQSVVYELHVGAFAGSFAAAQAKLGELAQLGVNVVELMPVTVFGGTTGWGYNPQLYDAPNPAWGTPDQLRAFVDAAHAHGLAVWLDFVVNHMDGWRQAPVACFDDGCPAGAWGPYFFPQGTWATTPWGPRPNYPEPQVVSWLLGAARVWLDEFHGDGFRWDSVSNIRAVDGQGTTPGGRELLVAGNALTHARGGLSVAEDLKGDDAITRASAAGGFGFDAQWDGLGYDLGNLLASSVDGARDLGVIEGALQNGAGGDGFARVLWTEDHDTVGNGGARLPVRIDAASPESFPARRRAMLGAVVMLTSPGVPMLFMGQEFLATQGFDDPPATLATPTARGLEQRAFYRDLIGLRRNLGGQTGALLEPGAEVLHRNDPNKVIAYRRTGPSGEDVLVVLNFSNKAYTTYDVGVPAAGDWRVRLDTDWSAYGSDFGGGQTGTVTASQESYDGQPAKLPVKLGAYAGVIFSR
jgi:1,4-alpha-glucan branching enzyme